MGWLERLSLLSGLLLLTPTQKTKSTASSMMFPTVTEELLDTVHSARASPVSMAFDTGFWFAESLDDASIGAGLRIERFNDWRSWWFVGLR